MEVYGDMEIQMGVGFLIIYLVWVLFMLALAVASYVLRSLGIYTIARRRCLRNPWFAWVPVVDYYLLGCISDQYQYVVKGRNKSRRKILLTLNIVLWVLYAAFFVMYFVACISAVKGVIAGMNMDRMTRQVTTPLLAALCLALPMMGVSIVTKVFRYMALYDLYTSCSPQNNVLFLVLSIIFGVTEPFFIFFNRKKDGGMPPRKPEPQSYVPPRSIDEIPEEAPQKPREDTENVNCAEAPEDSANE